MTARPTRRTAMALVLAGPLALRLSPAAATPDEMRAAVDAFTGGRPVNPGRVTLDVPLLVENGNAVPLKVSVESPMTEDDYVKEVAIFNERNPLPDVIRLHFTPRSGRAAAETRIRLSGSQNVHAIARMSDGSLWSAVADVIVTAPACAES
ncbi:SoxY-related AACIE arm protein [uncultured Paracoccus sp.]|uniref:SoxY-related AACIE arm protein n=1 Tax=uncultured Paracoccus sp. TaxID=189685 RepID=UPI00261FDE65|nr:SoxY-related AACIE arm protein [uncultured Paracoccus sp.]